MKIWRLVLPPKGGLILPPKGGSHKDSGEGGRIFALAIGLLVLANNASAGVRRVWAVNDGEKVERDARNHPASAHNSVWDGRLVHVFGARNEVVAFQVIVVPHQADAVDDGLDFPSHE